ncbi:hypothetical protein X975_17271, partial [Stegodyphus mimosarum]
MHIVINKDPYYIPQQHLKHIFSHNLILILTGCIYQTICIKKVFHCIRTVKKSSCWLNMVKI